MKNKYLIVLFLLVVFNFNKPSFSQEFKFETSTIKISNDGNTITTQKGSVVFPKKNLRINGQSFKYYKDRLVLIITDGIAKFTKKKIKIYGDEFLYNEATSILKATGNVRVNATEKNIDIKSKNIVFDTSKGIIQSEFPTIITDYLNNQISVESFVYTISDDLIKISNIEIVDSDKNFYTLDKAFLNLKSNKLIGKDISINLNGMNLDKNNEPRLKGNSIVMEGNNTILKKSVFTTCKKNDKCPPWQLAAREIKHDKKKKTINYKDALLKVYDIPVFYFPKFFHPDPSVKRQSGFLVPKIQDSSSLGMSLNLPYFKALSDNKDLTFKPRLYSNNKLLAQSEFRQINKDSTHMIDFSILNDDKKNKNHFFYKSSKKLNLDNFDDANFSIKLESVSSDTYLKSYKLKSPLIKNENLLNSALSIDLFNDDLQFNADMEIYEDLTKEKSDRYEFILPNYSLIRGLENNTNLNGLFSLKSTGHMKNYDTNIKEKIFVNNLIFNSDKFLNNMGLMNEYNLIVKNVITDTQNSTTYKDNSDTTISSLLEYNSSYPMKKETDKYRNILKPQASIRFGTNQVMNNKNKDQRSSIEDIYSLNRSGSTTSLEEGISLTYGAKFEKTEKNNLEKNLLNFELANILRLEENEKSSRNSGLDEKISDVFGKFEYNPTDMIKFNYDFSVKNNFNQQNYEFLSTEFKVNNFLTTFEYLNEENTFDKESYLANTSTYFFDNFNNISFRTRKNKKTKLTEFYNLIYQYKNDCLTAAIEFKKDYYSDKDLKPDETLFLSLTIVPFGGANTPNLKP
jgi:LPS-assembly protein